MRCMEFLTAYNLVSVCRLSNSEIKHLLLPLLSRGKVAPPHLPLCYFLNLCEILIDKCYKIIKFSVYYIAIPCRTVYI